MFGSERSAKLVRKWLRLKPKEIQPVFCTINHGRCEDRVISIETLTTLSSVGSLRLSVARGQIIGRFLATRYAWAPLRTY